MRICNTTKSTQCLGRKCFSRLHVSTSFIAGGRKRNTSAQKTRLSRRQLTLVTTRQLLFVNAGEYFVAICPFTFSVVFFHFGKTIDRAASSTRNIPFFIRIADKSAVHLMADGNSLYEADLVMHLFPLHLLHITHKNMSNLLLNLSTIARRSGFCGCSNCCGGFGCPHICHHCCGGCCGCGCCGGCDSMTFPCTFGACVENPCCQCCKKPPKKGYCQWPCMWPCCCECKVPEFKLKPLKPKAVAKQCHDGCSDCCHGCCHGCCHCCHCCRKRGGKMLANNKQYWPKIVLTFLLRKLILLEYYNRHHRTRSQCTFKPRAKLYFPTDQ